MVKYSGKVNFRTGNTDSRVYDRHRCRGKNAGVFCSSYKIYGTGPNGPLCYKDFWKYKNKSKNPDYYKKGYTPKASKNQIPTCSKKGCVSVSFGKKNNLEFCQFHFHRV